MLGQEKKGLGGGWKENRVYQIIVHTLILPANLPACLPTYVLTYRKTSSFQKRGVDRRRGRAKQAGLKVG